MFSHPIGPGKKVCWLCPCTKNKPHRVTCVKGQLQGEQEYDNEPGNRITIELDKKTLYSPSPPLHSSNVPQPPPHRPHNPAQRPSATGARTHIIVHMVSGAKRSCKKGGGEEYERYVGQVLRWRSVAVSPA